MSKHAHKQPNQPSQHPTPPKRNRKAAAKQQKPYSLKDILGDTIPREDALAAIHADPATSQAFSKFQAPEQERILSFIQGAQGLKITYDSFFKYVMNPDAYPSRLEDFLSAILEQKVKIRSVLPTEGIRMSDAGSFVMMDIAVELSDGRVVNVEIQKVGYHFPCERASCYAADFIMRQYNRVRDERGKRFSFHNLKPVILIVIMENSPGEFAAASPFYIHREERSFQSGAAAHFLSKTIYISLDTFHSVVQNIDTELAAWLTFLSSDHPADIVRLANAYPKFLPCYHDIMEFRKKPKELMHMYSKSLAILDRNMEIFMCEELKKEVADLSAALADSRATLSEKDAALFEKNVALSKKDAALSAALSEMDHWKKKYNDLISKS